MNSQSLAITKLTANGWSVYFPISNDDHLIICSKPTNNAVPPLLATLSRCTIIKATADRSRCPIGRVPKTGISVDADYLLFSDTDNNRCWLIPRIDVSAFDSVRLGKRYDSFELGVVIASSKKDEEIRDKAVNLIKVLKDSR